MVRSQMVCIVMLSIVLKTVVFAQHSDQTYVEETDPRVIKKLEEWQNIKLGLLMHWGSYSQWGVVESWSICAEDEDWCRRSMDD